MNIDTSSISKVMGKLKLKDPVLFTAVQKKINQIAQLDKAAVMHFKNLSNYKRVHVKSFVLIFKIEGDTIIFDKLRHHDEAY